MQAIVLSALHRLIHLITHEKNETETLNDLPKVTHLSSFSLHFLHSRPSFLPPSLPTSLPFLSSPSPSSSPFYSRFPFLVPKSLMQNYSPITINLKPQIILSNLDFFMFILYSRVNVRVNQMFSNFMNSWDGVIHCPFLHLYFVFIFFSLPYLLAFQLLAIPQGPTPEWLLSDTLKYSLKLMSQKRNEAELSRHTEWWQDIWGNTVIYRRSQSFPMPCQ